jgi:glycosyltransferase involved in cell wall biosynthesis
MRIALVHDYLNQLGGGERVLDVLLNMFPQADLYTLLHDPEKTAGKYAHRIKKTSFLDFQFARNYHRLFIPLMPWAARSIDLGSNYDLIISDTAGFAKGIRYDRTNTEHISYIHTPLRYAWETETYFNNSPKNVAMKILAAPLFAYVRHWDYWAGQQPGVVLANSQYIADKMKRYYGRDAVVVYPPVDGSKFYFDKATSHPASTRVSGEAGQPQATSYYLAAGRLLHYKRFDLIIDAFNQLDLPLKIVGDGPEFEMLKKCVTSSKVEILGYVKDDEQLRQLYNGAKGFIMANEEDFGLVTAEAQACGTPVIAYGVGGSREIVTQETGILFNEQNVDSLVSAIKKFETLKFDREAITQRAQRFSRENFKKGIEDAVKRVMAVKI